MLKFLRKTLEANAHRFEKDGALEKLYPLFEATDTILFSTDEVTESGPHIRDSVDTKRVMILVVMALIPLYIFGAMNVGVQNGIATGIERTNGENFWFGFGTILPIIIITFTTGAFWEILFAIVRKHPISEGFLVTCALIPLVMPASIPLWQVSIATTFGIVIGKEIFGGTGYNIFNPALVTRAFLFFAYPSAISGDSVWTIVDGVSKATPLAVAAASEDVGGVTALIQNNYSFAELFYGFVPGSIGETSTLAILIGAFILIITKVANWRIMAGIMIGMTGIALLTNLLAGVSTNPMMDLTPQYHFVLGGFAFGMVFMATDPVSASQCDAGRWIYGILVGALVVVIRSMNPAFPEGMMLAILLGNAFSPMIDYIIVRKHIKRRQNRYAQ